MDTLAFALKADGVGTKADEETIRRGRERAGLVIGGLNEKQRRIIDDDSPLIGTCCPRRAGKTFMGASLALALGEANPGSIIVVVCMTLKQGRSTWWYGSTSGVIPLARKYQIPLTTNENELRWEHENGSIGYIKSAESMDTIESIRGMEADLYIIDECKSVPPDLLRTLLDDIIFPQTVSRDGRVLMIGTPGNLLEGPFWEATCSGASVEVADEETGTAQRIVTNVPFGTEDPHGRGPGEYWSYHTWTLEENNKTPQARQQWDKALRIKKRNRWADDNPTWQREYLGMWVPSTGGLVFEYLSSLRKPDGQVAWYPKRTPENPSGLPQELGPWRYVWGLDLGSHDPTALVVVAYSESVHEMRHVYDVSYQHLLVDDVAALLTETAKKFGPPQAIFADTANLGTMVVDTLRQIHGFHIEPAAKRDKNDHIELLNNEFRAGRCKVIPGTPLEGQLKVVAWDLSSNSKELLARTGRLREDAAIPNDLTDALMYAFRGCYHAFAVSPEAVKPLSIDEAFAAWEKANLARARLNYRREAEAAGGPRGGPTEPKFGRSAVTDPEDFVPWQN